MSSHQPPGNYTYFRLKFLEPDSGVNIVVYLISNTETSGRVHANMLMMCSLGSRVETAQLHLPRPIRGAPHSPARRIS